MVGMNAVGNAMGAMPMMNNGVGGVPRESQGSAHEGKQRLNTHIYDYFIKNELYDCARAMIQSDCPINTLPSTKTSPGRRRDGEVNGIDENGMDTDSKDDVLSKRPEDLPVPNTPQDIPEGSFLYDWWCLFWDVFSAQRTKKPKPGEPLPGGQGGLAMQYVQHTQASRMRQEQQQQMLRQMNPQINQQLNQQYQNMMRAMPPSGMNMAQGELRQKALQNSRNATPQMMQQMKNQQMMHQAMQRDGSDNDINGQQRPNSPSSAENAPSPSKRPRLDGGPFMMPNGRGQPQGMPGNSAQAVHANQLLTANGINPGQLTPSQFNSFQQQNPTVQQKSIQVYAQNLAQHQRSALNNQTMPKGMTNAAGVPNQGSPMMQGADVQNLGPVVMNDFYTGQPAPQMRGMQGGNGQGGNHALQDYQMQLMLLEQQNKKRLMMARQEQDLQQRPDGAPGPNGQAAFPPGMSPQGSRSGQSPGPNDQMKRGTPKINPSGLPGSPLPDGSMPNTRGSPGPMNFQPGQMPPDMTPQLYQQQMKTMGDMAMGGVPHGNVMRPPSSHPQPLGGHQFNPAQLELIARQQQQQVQVQQAGRMPNGNWQQGPQGQMAMMQQPPPGQQPQPMGTPQARNQQMPPPQAPPAGANTNGRTQPSSPQPPVAPSPQQSNKANPKGKKEGKPKRPTKKGSTTTAATPSAEADPAPTPTPSTPITPQNANSFSLQKGQNGPGQTGNTQAPTSAQVPATLAQPQPEQNHVGGFGSMDDSNNAGFDLTFGSLDTGDVLESFDFDSYLTEGDATGGPFNFDPSLTFGNPDGVEAGTGDV
ncbi:MAG: hypothetical protein M1812_003599 [Candelaria pacifica]|nr:MAG: hypothetical protein M1812_003599 [Candelaria pacifica]